MAKKKKIDPHVVKSLATISCTQEEIAFVCKCSVDTLHRRFAEVIKEGTVTRNISLRRMAWKQAEKGNTAMIIFLLKTQLGMAERVIHENAKVSFQTLSDEDVDNAARSKAGSVEAGENSVMVSATYTARGF